MPRSERSPYDDNKPWLDNSRAEASRNVGFSLWSPGALPAIGGLLVKDFHITDTQLKALVADPPVLVAAEVGVANLVVAAWGLADLTTGYTVPAGSFLLITTPAARAASTFDGFREVASAGLLDQTGTIPFTLISNNVGGVNANPFATSDANFLGGPLDGSLLENQAVILTNDRAGELTGGNAANSLWLRIWYTPVPIIAG